MSSSTKEGIIMLIIIIMSKGNEKEHNKAENKNN